MSDSEVVWGMGKDPLCLRSDVMEMKEKGKVSFSNEFSFEWRGSYAELENQAMEVELWRWNRFRANTLDSCHKQPLVDYATGPVFQEIQLHRANIAQGDGAVGDEKDEIPRFKVTFQLYFQEIYDFELNVVDVQAFGLLPESFLAKASPAELVKNSASIGIGDVDAEQTSQTGTSQSIFEPSDSSGGEQSDEETNALNRGTQRVKRLSMVVVRAQSKAVVESSKLKRRVQMEIKNPTFGHSFKRGAMVIRSPFKRVDKGHSNLDRWGNVGRIHYRGTWADLDNDLLYLSIYETKALDPTSTVIGKAAVSLRGVTEYGATSGSCAAPDWVIKSARKRYSQEEVKRIMKSNVGRFEAKISVENQPKYRQSGELCDMVSDKAYLLVRVLRVDRLAIPDQRPINQCDSAVQVQFSGNSYETEVRQDTISPQFNQEFYFELKTNVPAEFSPQELAAMHGPIIFDVWLRSDDDGALSAEHCGHVEVSLMDIFTEGKPETKFHTSIRTGAETEYRTAVLKGRRRLKCLWTDAGPNVNVPASAAIPSYLYVDVWLRPFDFSAFSMQSLTSSTRPTLKSSATAGRESLTSSNNYNDPLLPGRVKSEWVRRASVWEEKAKELQSQYWTARNRRFQYLAQSQNRDQHFLPLFLDVIRPPEILSNVSAIAFWIHCLSHTSMEDLKAAVEFWATPDFTLSLGKGDTFAHAILHCSMIRGLPDVGSRPFVCVGTGWDSEPLAWVMTMNPDGSVTFWDTAANRQFRLQRRCVDVHRCKRVAGGNRPPGLQLSDELVQMERKRRKRLGHQDAKLSKLSKMHTDMIDCDPDILRAGEILKIVDPQIHQHALVYSSDVPMKARCMQCGAGPVRKKVHGYICNKRISGKLSGEDACATDEKTFLCLTCAEKALHTVSDSEVQTVPDAECKFADQPVLPYKTIDVVFDNTNVWMNLQHFSPTSILYDLWNPDYWQPFTSISTVFRSFSLASKGLRKARAGEYFENIKGRVLTKLYKAIESVRRNGNLATFFQKDALLVAHIEKGLDLAFRAELVDQVNEADGLPAPGKAKIDAEIDRWKLELYSKVPKNHKFVGHTFLFSFTDAAEISRIVLDRIDFIAQSLLGTQFVVACYTGKLPNSVKAAYVYVGIVSPLSPDNMHRVVEQRTHDSFQTNATTNVFTDEVVERNKLFTQRIQVFENDTDFISRMRADLYNKGSGGPTSITFKSTSKAPGSFMAQRSFVDEGGDETDALLGEGRDMTMPEIPEEPVEMSMGSSFSNPFGNLTSVFAARQAAEEQMEEETDQPESSALLERASGAAGTAMSMFGSLFNSGGQSGETMEQPVEQSAVTRPPVVRPPVVKDLHRQGHVTSPFSRVSALNPTPEELAEIYKPYTVEKVVSQKKYLKHVDTGYLIPLPPQEPLRRAVELGAGHLTTEVQVSAAQIAKNTKKVPPPKEVIYEYNMSLSSGSVSPKR